MVEGLGSIVGYDNITYEGVVEDAPLTDPLQNPGFEIPNGASWNFFQGGGSELGSPTVTFPATGGNPGGHAIIDASTGGFAGLTSNNTAFVALERFDIEPGTIVIFSMDMKVISGLDVGQMKLEFLDQAGELGSTGDTFPIEFDVSSDWLPYTFEFVIPDDAVSMRIVPVSGPDSIIGYDNVRAGPPIPVTEPLTLSITSGTSVSWVPTGNLIYQPEESQDGVNFVAFGTAFPGTAVTTTFDPTPAPFYRVLERDESTSTVIEATSTPGARLQYRTISGLSYQIESSSDMLDFTPVGDVSVGTGSLQNSIQIFGEDKQFFRVSESE